MKDGDFDTPRGVIVYLHGGGWTIGRPETEAPICRYLADTVGVVVVAPDYRKAPKYPYPHALEQTYQVTSWIASGGLSTALKNSRIQEACALQVDTKRVGIAGGSAGSNLACALSTLCISRPLPNGAKVVAQGLLYPVLDLAVPYEEKLARVDPERVLPQWMSRFFLRAYLPPPRLTSDSLVSPALSPDSIASQLPPTIILTAEYDYLAHEADTFATRLEALNVKVRHRRFESVGHGFDGIPTWDKKQRMLNSKARDEAWGMIADVMKETLV
ncbi:Alpha/beta hydrolase fold-3 [Fomitiporia mediterranea MF3/22]|uniref:Alpha/beta hydrolase fold-3 n=1 Tax=Fomitiporia mediterranea (strain MF3/22) TaxID=694068 RepID=UPI0004409113|nr:Alpha/beta hydrolase fold-3 [Fomitiporia mediterranea MF3/22]EJC98411.1 Alpha/beta hydrolase fold-3 [Fomitiporia mediterranea MF3/22]